MVRMIKQKTIFSITKIGHPRDVHTTLSMSERKSKIKEKLFEGIRHFTIGGGLLTVIFAISYRQGLEPKQLALQWGINGSLWGTLAMGNDFVLNFIDKYISWLEEPIKRFIVSTIATITYTLISGVAVFVLYFSLVYHISFAKAYQEINMGFWLPVTGITVVVSLFLHGRSFLLSWRESVVEAEQHKRVALASKYESLKNQVNPHFLFNSLNVLSTLVYKDQDLAARFIKQMSRIYRYVLETKDQEVVPLKTELEAIDAYIFLVKIRFGENISFEVKVDADEDMVVAPLTLQMLVENAVKHNIISKADPLWIKMYQEENYIIVENNLQIKNNQQESMGIGLPNIKERYQLLSDHELKVEDNNETFKVYIPIVRLKEEL